MPFDIDSFCIAPHDIPEEIKPIALTKQVNGFWMNEDGSIASFQGFSNIPPLIEMMIEIINPEEHSIKNKKRFEALTGNEGYVSLYRMTNFRYHQSVYRTENIDAALLNKNPEMYLIRDNSPLLIEHDEGYVLVSSVTLSNPVNFV